MALVVTYALAEITLNGLWTGEDWYKDQYKIGVANGVPYSNDTATNRTITAPMALDGAVTDYLTKENVIRVKEIVTEEKWDHLFPKRDEVYTYDGFLNAVGKFPKFCMENGDSSGNWTNVTMCKRELATMFAHFVQETSMNSQWEADNNGPPLWRQGLYYIENIDCEGGDSDNSACDYHDYGWADEAWPNQPGKQYYARGPFQLAWNYNYGRFSNIFNEGQYNSKMELLEDPDQVHTDGFTVFSSALWYYMTPQSPKPSMHDVVTEHFQPNDADTTAGIQGTFGTTTNIINGGDECGWAAPFAHRRADFYQEFLTYFGISDSEGSFDCDGETPGFPAGSAGAIPSYFTWDWTWGNDQKCQVVTWQTEYSIYAKDDYKRCVCNFVGDGINSCPQA